jgi:ribonuclease VapC
VIAVDTSALLAILLDEPEASSFTRLITEHDCVIGTPTCLEALIVVSSRGAPTDLARLESLFQLRNFEILPFTLEHLRVAQSAFERFRAKLNFGDCMAYAVARCADAPLLYKGDDFAATDIPAAMSVR